VLFGLQTPEVSETNLYDALIFALKRMRPVVGRKAIILISSGVDTFSKSAYEDVLATARDCNTPVYAFIPRLDPATSRQSARYGGPSGAR